MIEIESQGRVRRFVAAHKNYTYNKCASLEDDCNERAAKHRDYAITEESERSFLIRCDLHVAADAGVIRRPISQRVVLRIRKDEIGTAQSKYSSCEEQST